MKRIADFFKNIPEEICISKREFLLTIAVSVLGGLVLGMLGSPRKTQNFGSYNAVTNNEMTNNGDSPEEDDE